MYSPARLLPLLALALPVLASSHKPKKYVTSTALQKLVKLDDLLAGAQKLQDFADAHDGTRVFGSAGHNATVDYLYKTLKATGYYNVVKQPFTEIYSSGTSTLSVDGESVDSTIMTYTPSGSATGTLVAVSNLGCDASDYPSGTDGHVVLISRGTCTFATKAINAKAAGAVGAIVYNNVEGSLSGTLGAAFGDYAPIVGISLADGEAILAALEEGDVTVDFEVDAVTEDRVTFNVIAETKGGDHKNVLVLGGHTDSVAAGPGIK